MRRVAVYMVRHFAGCLKPRGEKIFREYEKAEWRVKDADQNE